MEFVLTSKYKHSVRCKDKKRRNFEIFYLNGIEILKQKVPFDETYDHGFQNRTWFENIYLLDGKLYGTRRKPEFGTTNPQKIRSVYYPVSKEKLKQFAIPSGLKIELTK